MSYVICGKCGGYYKLQEGESFEDFDKCQCGGNLSYAKYIPKTRKKPKNNIKCRICGHEQERTLVCSKCGSKIRPNTNHWNRTGYRHLAEDDLLDRIDFNAIKSGVLFYILALIIMFIVRNVVPAFISFVGLGIISQSGTHDIAGAIYEGLTIIGIIDIVIVVIYMFIPILSGFIAVNELSTDDYVTGMVNGGLVGFIVGITLGFLTLVGLWITTPQMDLTTVAILISIIKSIFGGGISAAAGGLIAVYVKRHTSFVLGLRNKI